MSTAGTAVSAIRRAAEMTPGDLAKAAGIDLALLHKLEAGDEDGVSTADVARLARVLRVDPIDLMTGKATAASSPTVYFRQSAYPDFYDVDRMKLLDALDRAHALVAIDLVLARGLGLRRCFTPLPVGPKPWESGYHLGAEVRAALGNLDRPLGDLKALLEDVFEVEVLVDRFRATSVHAVSVKQEPGAAVVILDSAALGYGNPLRRRIDLAHELAHVLFDEPNGAINVAIDRGPDLRRAPSSSGHAPEEQRANAFAAELLIPRLGLLRLFGVPERASSYEQAFERVQRTREEFKTPKEIAVHHLDHRGYIDHAFHDALLRARYPSAGKAPERYGRRSALERRVLHALAGHAISGGRARELLGLSAWDELPEGMEA